MNSLHLIVHIIVCLVLIFIVLLQVGKRADQGFLSGDSNHPQHSGGKPSFIVKFTTIVAIAFLVSSFFMTFNSTKKANLSVIEKVQLQHSKKTGEESNGE